MPAPRRPSCASIRTIDFNYDDFGLDDASAGDGDSQADDDDGSENGSDEFGGEAASSGLSDSGRGADVGGGAAAAGRRDSLHNSVTCDAAAPPPPPPVADAGDAQDLDLDSTGHHSDDGLEYELDHVNRLGLQQNQLGSFSKYKGRGDDNNSRKKGGGRGACGYLRGPLVALVLAAIFGATFYVGRNHFAALDAQATSGYADLEGVTDMEQAAGEHATSSAASNDKNGARFEPNTPAYVQEMPYPVGKSGGTTVDKYDWAFPHHFEHNLAETIAPHFREEEVPLLFAATGSGGELMETVLGECFGLVSAGENGREMEWRDEDLAVLSEGGKEPFVNVDLQSSRGIDRAASLRLASSGLADYLSSTALLGKAVASLFSGDDDRRRGRMVAVLRHPVARALERYYEVRSTVPGLASMTPEEYAASGDDLVESNMVTRLLSGHLDDDALGGELGRAHVDLAKEVLRRKALILLHDDGNGNDGNTPDVNAESLRRVETYFGLLKSPDAKGCWDAKLNNHKSIEAGKAVEYGPTPREGEPAYLKILERNKFDLELYEYAKELFAAQADLPSHEVKPSDQWKWDTRDCVENGKFSADPPVSNWYAVQSNLKVVEGRDGKGNALEASERGHQIFGGMWQNIEADCLRTGEWYEVRATVRATTSTAVDDDDGNSSPAIFECDPTILYNNVPQSCPAVGVRIGTGMKEVALTVGPLAPPGSGGHGQEWMELRGVFRATSAMTTATVSAFVSRASPEVDLAVDRIRISPATDETAGVMSDDCSNPIVNGDAETGDHRFWFVRGAKGGGRIEMVSPGYGGSKHAFRHAGSRENRYRGMLQRLDASCFTEGTTWTISARFRYFSMDEATGEITFVACQKDNPKATDSCPVFDMDFISPNGNKVNTGPLPNEAQGEAKTGEWNEIRHTVTVTPEMALRPQVLVYVNSVDARYNYDLDDVRMERVDG